MIAHEPTKTAEDARIRVLNARLGSLADNPSWEYLLELEAEIQRWADAVTAERKRRLANELEAV